MEHKIDRRTAMTTLLAAGLAASGLIHSFADGTHQSPESKAGQSVDPRLIESNNAFGLTIFQTVLRAKGEQNICLSPVGAAMALQMTYNGAKGETKSAMEQALGLAGMSLDALNRNNAALLSALNQNSNGLTLQIANSLWAGRGGKLEPKADFVQRVRQFYSARVGDLIGAPETINAWVRKATNNKIDSIVGQSDLTNAVAVLVNALYFKGQWTMPFDKNLTRPGVFHTSEGHRRDIKMMHQEASCSYLKAEGFQAVRLPYGGGASALLFLPDEGEKFNDLLARLTPDHWRGLKSQFRPGKGEIALPRFRSEYSIELNDALKSMGMEAAFSSGKADFSGMIGRPGEVYISLVRQKTYIEVNEEGTEAAAAYCSGYVERDDGDAPI